MYFNFANSKSEEKKNHRAFNDALTNDMWHFLTPALISLLLLIIRNRYLYVIYGIQTIFIK